ncbi:MAG: DNA methyltransferase [Cyanobacteria bacterium]|nr:DNA methyltransferase [Cyanobacteriota bacterium]
MKQKRDRYEMHKYWGKKPSSDLGILIQKYSHEGDTVLDPFSGYGVFCCEAYLLNRNVISNDLNPVASFLNDQLLEKEVNLDLLQKQWKKILVEFKPFVEKWFEWKVDGTSVQLSSILRDKNDIPIKAKYKFNGNRKATEIEIDSVSANKFIQFEKSHTIEDWYPTTPLVENSRISAKKGMRVSDLFTKRTLSCHAKLLSLIEKHSSGNEKDLFKVAFTANLANCSRLVPPIKSRGDMAPGAWMTGFYTGETYLENNVLQYFENRLNKVIKGKKDFLSYFGTSDELDLNPIEYNNTFRTIKQDAKNLDVESESIDYIFTDPPYGDAVPYFEQSAIWNSWLKLTPDYKNEVVLKR